MSKLVHFHPKKCLRIGMALALTAGLLLGLCACGPKETNTTGDILTQKPTQAGKTPITVLGKFAFSLNSFEMAVEEKFPNIDIIQVNNHSGNMGIAEYEARMKNDDLPDMIFTWPVDAGEEYCAERLMDLSGMEFTSRYNLSMLNDISKDGKLYYLPGPAQVRGILYNKTMFQENNWQVPKDFEGFISLCKTIEASGIRSLQFGFEDAEVLDTAFVGYGYSEAYSQPQDMKWMDEYAAGKGSFGDHFSTALNTFQRLVEESILQPEDLEVNYKDREMNMANRQCVMVEDAVILARALHDRSAYGDEFALMPFFNPDGTDWARLYMVCYIGLNQHLAEEANKSKYKLVMDIMDYISTPEGQDALMGDNGTMFSSLVGTSTSDVPELVNMKSALDDGRVAIFPQLKNAQTALREGLVAMLKGEMTIQQVIAEVDKRNLSPTQVDPLKILGHASEDFSMIETGNYITDVMRKQAGSDIALFLDNGKDGKNNANGLCGRWYAGELTTDDVMRMFETDTKNLCTVKMTGKDLLQILEYSVKLNNDSNWFYYFSGLRMEFAPTAQAGSRIKKISLDNGKELKPDQLYSIAIMDGSIPDEYLKSHMDTGINLSLLLEESIAEAGTISPSKDGRMTIVNP